MAYDEDLANRVRAELAEREDVTEQPMFGGLAFMLKGHMAVSVSGRGGLMLRVGADATERALSRPHTELLEMRGRPMMGWVRVAPEGVSSKRQLETWVRRGVEFASTLPPK
jgi:TfoX/Sxy family transcriptional regulator of competence genes